MTGEIKTKITKKGYDAITVHCPNCKRNFYTYFDGENLVKVGIAYQSTNKIKCDDCTTEFEVKRVMDKEKRE